MSKEDKKIEKTDFKEIEKIAKKSGDAEMLEQAKQRAKNRETTK